MPSDAGGGHYRLLIGQESPMHNGYRGGVRFIPFPIPLPPTPTPDACAPITLFKLLDDMRAQMGIFGATTAALVANIKARLSPAAIITPIPTYAPLLPGEVPNFWHRSFDTLNTSHANGFPGDGLNYGFNPTSDLFDFIHTYILDHTFLQAQRAAAVFARNNTPTDIHLQQDGNWIRLRLGYNKNTSLGIPKGESLAKDATTLMTALREFREEIGVDLTTLLPALSAIVLPQDLHLR